MKGYIIGYNGKSNFGDELMLSSNIKFLERLGCSEILVLNWTKYPVKKTTQNVGRQSYLELSGRFFILIWRLFLSCITGRSFFLIGGGNLFD